MQAINANEARTKFGDMLLKAQRAPVQINKNGKPVAVVLSIGEYQEIDRLKLQLLQEKILRARHEMDRGHVVDGEDFLGVLIAGSHDDG